MGGQKHKKVYLEIMRVLAIFAVLFCHTGYYGAHHYLEANNGINYWTGIFLASVSQFCIPMFFMISGAVLLNREESIAYVYRHRVLKMVLATLFAVLVQYLWNYYHDPGIGLDFDTFLRLTYEGGASIPHWFLYGYISFLLFLPFLQKLVKIIPDEKWFLYLFLAWEVIHGIFPILEYYQEWAGSKLELSVSDYAVYAILGYFLEHYCEEFFYNKKNILMVLAGTAVLVLENMHLNDISLADSTFVGFGAVFAPVYAFAIFVVVKYICHRWTMSPALEEIFCFAGAGVFGTYLLEGILRETFLPIYLYLNTRIYSYPAVFVWLAVCVFVGVIISNIFKRIPYLGKIL